jgi:hypothetical protein
MYPRLTHERGAPVKSVHYHVGMTTIKLRTVRLSTALMRSCSAWSASWRFASVAPAGALGIPPSAMTGPTPEAIHREQERKVKAKREKRQQRRAEKRLAREGGSPLSETAERDGG